MITKILGTSAGGGCPQWNCACAQCAHLRMRNEHRTGDCLAISNDNKKFWLLNASPDLCRQLSILPPSIGRETPIQGVLLTDAELDHTLGLFLLREARSLDVYATDVVLDALPRAMLTAYTDIRWHVVKPGVSFLLSGMTVMPFALGTKSPRYVATSPGDWVIGYRIMDLVYAPCFATWRLDPVLNTARFALIDGTFFSRDEMPHVSGHMPMMESLPKLSYYQNVTFLYTHLNNTNPMLLDDHAITCTSNAFLASDGQILAEAHGF